MNDFDKLTEFLKDVQVLDRMQQRYPSGTPLWAAVAACLEAFQRHGALLDPFFGRVPAKAVDPPAEPPKPVAPEPPPPPVPPASAPPRRRGKGSGPSLTDE